MTMPEIFKLIELNQPLTSNNQYEMVQSIDRGYCKVVMYPTILVLFVQNRSHIH
jgi:hypothetical protein